MVVVPEIVPALAGKGFTVIARVEEAPSPHEKCPLTVMSPETADDP